jgi:hypothetical protein
MALMTQVRISIQMDSGMHWIAQVQRVLLALRVQLVRLVQLVLPE